MSKKGGGGAQTQSTSSSSAPPTYLLPYLQQALSGAQNLYQAGPPSLYPNQTYAPINPTQQAALNQTLAYGNSGPNQATATGIKTLEDAANSNPDPSQNPYIMDLIKQQGLGANQIVAGNFNHGGRYGSGAQAAAAGTAITNAQLPTLAAQYNTDMQNKLTSAALLPNAGTTQDTQNLSRAQATGTVGDAYASDAQKAINEAMQRYQYANGGGQSQLLQNYIKQISGLPNSGGTTTGTTSVSGKSQGLGGMIGNINAGLGAIGGLGSGLQSFLGSGSNFSNAVGSATGLGSLFADAGGWLGNTYYGSDQRLKENIQLVGQENGHNVYEFEYRSGSGQRYRGVMAQEVLKKNPEAVVYDSSGYMKVNYGLIGVKFREIGANTPVSASAPASQGGLIEAGAAGCAGGGL